MPTARASQSRFTVQPLSPERWDDFARLFGPNGACGGCWCMLWRLPRGEYDKGKGPGNRRAMKKLVDAGAIPGLLAYAGDEPIGWCALAPRADYPALARSRLFKPIDDRPVWSVSCLFIAKAYRNQGVSVRLLQAAAQHVKSQGGRILEGYPVEPKKLPMPAVFAWTGTVNAFRKAGFKEVARPSPTRPVMRRTV